MKNNREAIIYFLLIAGMVLLLLVTGLFAWGYYVADAPEWVKSLTEFLRNYTVSGLDNIIAPVLY